MPKGTLFLIPNDFAMLWTIVYFCKDNIYEELSVSPTTFKQYISDNKNNINKIIFQPASLPSTNKCAVNIIKEVGIEYEILN